MTLLAAAAQQSTTTTTTTAVSGGPYNAASYLTTPTYDGSGNAVHPDVVDFGVTGWNGWRFWMAMTPYPNSNDDYENPSVLVSADGSTWQVPAGLTNPIYPEPASGWNSDTDLVYDPVSDELVLIYRDQTFHPNVARSSDGVTWPASPTPVTWDAPTEECASPAIVRLDDGSWLLFGISYPTRSITMRWSAAALEGPWTRLPDGSGLGSDSWHIDVYRSGGVLHALVSDGRENEPALHKIRAASSSDFGVTWTPNATPVIPKGPSGAWDSSLLYRGSIQPHENGTHYRVWYSGCKNRFGGTTDSWHIGLTHIPLTAWPSPPATTTTTTTVGTTTTTTTVGTTTTTTTAGSLVLTESFNQADSTTLGPDLTWNEFVGDLQTVSNRCRVVSLNTGSGARASHDLTNANHYTQVQIVTMTTVNTNNVRVLARAQVSTLTWYEAVLDGVGTVFLRKCVGGTVTALVANSSITLSPPHTLRVEANGSTIRAVVDGVTILTATDTSITSGNRTGIRLFNNSGNIANLEVDNFETGDL